MSLATLPVELLCMIGSHLELESDLNSLIQTCHRFYEVFNDELYRDVGEAWSVIKWATQKDLEPVIRRLLATGVDPTRHEMNTAIFVAAEHGRLGIIKLFLTHGVKVELRNNGSETPTMLFCAAEQGHELVIRLLLAEGADPNILNYDGHTALMAAVSGGHQATVELLLENGASVDIVGRWGETPLSVAVRSGHNSLVRLFVRISPRTHLEIRHDEETPLAQAISKGWTRIVIILLEAGVDIHREDGFGHTPLWHAASSGCLEIVQLLLAVDSSEIYMRPAVDAAFQGGHAEVFAYLLDNNAPLELDLDGKLPLQVATERHHTALAKLLIERDLFVSEEHSPNGSSPLRWAVTHGDAEIVYKLLELGHGKGNVPSSYWPLYYAVLRADTEIIARLLESGVPQGYGPTLLCRAASFDREKMVELLLQRGVYIDARNEDGATALSEAAANGCEKVVRLLLQHGANPSLKDRNGNTALSSACQLGRADIVLAFLDNGTPPETWGHSSPSANNKDGSHSRYEEYIDTPDNFHRTPLFLATMLGHEEIVRMLLARGSKAIQTPTCAGRTPLSLAARYRRHVLSERKDPRLQFIWQWLRFPGYVSVTFKDIQEANSLADNPSLYWCENCGVPISRYTEYFWCIDDDGHYEYHHCPECVSLGARCPDATRLVEPDVEDENGTSVPMTDENVDNYNDNPDL